MCTFRYQQGVHNLPAPPSAAVQFPCSSHSSNTCHLISPSVQPAVLANDLLQVEAHLQSKVRLLETEKRELSIQVLELERTFVQHKKQCQDEKEALVAQHEERLLQVSQC